MDLHPRTHCGKAKRSILVRTSSSIFFTPEFTDGILKDFSERPVEGKVVYLRPMQTVARLEPIHKVIEAKSARFSCVQTHVWSGYA